MRGLGCGAEPRGRAKHGGERARQGLEALDYAEHTDYDLVESTNPAFNKALVRINVFRAHRQARTLARARGCGRAESPYLQCGRSLPGPRLVRCRRCCSAACGSPSWPQ